MDFNEIGNWFKNTGTTIGNKLKTGYNTYAPKVGNFLSQNKRMLIGGLGGGILGALDAGNKKNLIKASYYKNPYLNASLTPEYSLNDDINNLVGILGMYGQGGNKGNGGFVANLFKPASLQEKLKDEKDLDGLKMSGDAYSPRIIPGQYDDYIA